jgi:hypothetical protein
MIGAVVIGRLAAAVLAVIEWFVNLFNCCQNKSVEKRYSLRFS